MCTEILLLDQMCAFAFFLSAFFLVWTAIWFSNMVSHTIYLYNNLFAFFSKLRSVFYINKIFLCLKNLFFFALSNFNGVQALQYFFCFCHVTPVL